MYVHMYVIFNIYMLAYVHITIVYVFMHVHTYVCQMEAKQFEKSVHNTWSHQREEKSKVRTYVRKHPTSVMWCSSQVLL